MKISHIFPNGGKLILFVLIAFMASCSLNGNSDDNSGVTGYQYDAQGYILHPTGALEDDPARVQDSNNYISASILKSTSTGTGTTTIPASLDLSSQFPPVGDQGKQGSCVGWAVGYAMKTYLERQEEGWPVTFPKYQFSPAWIYNQIRYGTNLGIPIDEALDFVVAQGCDTLEKFPYDQNDYDNKPDTASLMRAVKYRSRSWAYAGAFSFLGHTYWSPDIIKWLLASGAPVVIRVLDYPDLDHLNSSNPVYDTIYSTNRGGHALCLVGYDDDKRAFKFMNSWGTSWGINGYGWISYDLINNSSLGFSAYTMMDSTNIATEIYVSSTGSDAYPGTVMRPLLSIQKAIDLAISRGFENVMVASGTYHERIEIPHRTSFSRFSLLGGWDANFVNCYGYSVLDATGTTGNNALLCMVSVNAETYVNRFVFQNNTNNKYVGYIPPADFKARSCGIYLSNVANTRFSNCVIRNNSVGGGYAAISSAIYMVDSSVTHFFNIMISNNSGFSAPVYFTGGSCFLSLSGSVNDNKASVTSGIELNDCALTTIKANIYNNSSSWGYGALKIYGGASIDINGAIYNNNGGGLALLTNTPRYYNINFTNCKIYGNTPFNLTNI